MTAIGMAARIVATGVPAWYGVFLLEHLTHYMMHAPWAARWPLWSSLRAIHMRHHDRYRAPGLLQKGPYRGDGGVILLLPNLPLVAALCLALPADLFALAMGQAVLFLVASDYLHSQFHVAGSWLERFAWFHRRRRYHFDHHH